VAVEFALLAPVLVLLVVGLIDFGGYMSTRQALINAARNGAVFAATNPSTTSALATAPVATIQGQVQAEDGSSGLSIPNNASLLITYTSATNVVCATYDAIGGLAFLNSYLLGTCMVPGTLIEVKVTYAYTPLTPIVGSVFSAPLTIIAKASYPEVR
jgi:Flp pilus assembly protein TadG